MVMCRMCFFGTSLVIASCLLGCNTPPTGWSDRDTQSAMREYLDLSSVARTSVKDAQDKFANDPNRLRTVRRLYGAAKAKADAFIDLICVNLYANALQEDQVRDEIKRAAEELGDAVTRLNNSMVAARPFAVEMNPYVGLIPPIIDGGIRIWKAHREARQDQLERLEKKLTTYRWKDWSQI